MINMHFAAVVLICCLAAIAGYEFSINYEQGLYFGPPAEN